MYLSKRMTFQDHFLSLPLPGFLLADLSLKSPPFLEDVPMNRASAFGQ